ncbi:MAG TPA: methyltransferase domain-containing protein [Myxococcales bacterium]|nr:methyltransferase domain-containing protein [Myxococcales bacterium]
METTNSPLAADVMDRPQSTYDYAAIPDGHYDRVLREGNPIRRLWHLSKFERVLNELPRTPGQSLLDIGCFAGSFLSMADGRRFSRQLGVDVLPPQIDYANAHYGNAYRSFQSLKSITGLSIIRERFDCVTLIEVIEHLTAAEIRVLFSQTARLLERGGKLIVTTPNYASTWPLLEQILNRVSDVSYEEQHITRFNYFNFEKRLEEIYPALRDEFAVELKTTTHFVTPFLAGVSFELASKLSRLLPSAHWRMPFGNLVLASLVRRG